jgi:hypothetical protein
MQQRSLLGLTLAFCSLFLVINVVSKTILQPATLAAHITPSQNRQHRLRDSTSSDGERVSSQGYSGLATGAENYYHPQRLKVPASAPILAQDPIGQWSDVMQRFTRELSTDTMEIANLDNEVRHLIYLFMHPLCNRIPSLRSPQASIIMANNQMLQAK